MRQSAPDQSFTSGANSSQIPFYGNWTNWMYKVPPVKCIDTFAAVYVAAGLSIIHDVIILAMPIPILWSLNLAWQKKVNLSVMFSVGSFVILCSLLRLPSLRKLKGSTDPSCESYSAWVMNIN